MVVYTQLKDSPIRIIRSVKGLAQADVAAECGISTATLSNIERRRSAPSPDLRRRLAEALGCDMETLAEESLVVEIRRPDEARLN